MEASALLQVIRIKSRDSAWVYQVFEASEGMVSYSTLPAPRGPSGEVPLAPTGEATCDLELLIPVGYLTELSEVLEQLQRGGVWMVTLSEPRPLQG